MTGGQPGTGARAPGRAIGRYFVRAASQDDAPSLATLAAAAGLSETPSWEGRSLAWLDDAGAVATALQTGQAMLVAERAGGVVAMVRHGDSEGIAWFDLLASRHAGAGWTLIRAVEMAAQDGGLRLVRCRVPDEAVLEDYFGWLGYLPISREEAEGNPVLVLERRLPLLTVRDQRREDAGIITMLTGLDSYAFELGHRPGWFIVADGDRVAGVAWVSDAGGGGARAEPPVLVERYRGRRLEPWILERLAYHASHAGYHTITAARDPWLDAARRELEDRGWHAAGDLFVRTLSTPPAPEDA